jgi:hypothetical protein
MTYPNTSLLSSFGILQYKSIPPRTHYIQGRRQLINIPSTTPNQYEFLENRINLKDGVDQLCEDPIFKTKFSPIILRVLEYNIGKDQKYARVMIATDIQDNDISTKNFLLYLKTEKSRQNSKIYTNPSYVSGTDDNGIGHLYVEQKYLTLVDPSIKDFNSDRYEASYEASSEKDIEYQESLKRFVDTQKYNQISGLGPTNWKENFKFFKNDKPIEWELKRSDSYTQDGEVFFDRRLASYCVSVLVDESRYDFNIFNDAKYEQIKRKGFNRIAEYLNLGTLKNEAAYELDTGGAFTKIDLILNKNYYEIVKIIDVYTISREDAKFKFLVSVPHRYIAKYINQNVSPVQAATVKIAEYALNAVDSNRIDLQKDLNNYLNSLSPEEREKINKYLNFNVQTELVDKGLSYIRQKFIEKTGNSTILANGYDTFIKSLVGSSYRADIPIDAKDPYLFFNLSPDKIDSTREVVKKYSKRVGKLDSLNQEYLKKHRIEPALSLPNISAGMQRLFDKLVLFATEKVSFKLSVSSQEAESLLRGIAIYFEGDPNTFGNFLLQDIEEFFVVIGIDIIYGDNEYIKIGSTKKQEFDSISELSDKTVLFLYYLYVEAAKYLEDNLYITDYKLRAYEKESYQGFITKYIFPPLNITNSPSKDDDFLSGNLECAENIGKNLSGQLARQTKNLRSSTYNSAKNLARSKDVAVDRFSKMLYDPRWNLRDELDQFLLQVLTNIDLNSLVVIITDCLKKKDVPLQEIEKLIRLLLAIHNRKTPILCMLPPINLPQIPSLNISLRLPVLDIVGAVEQTVLKIIQDTVNKVISDLLKSLLDNLIDCEGAFEATNDTTEALSSLLDKLKSSNDAEETGGSDGDSGSESDIGSGSQALQQAGDGTDSDRNKSGNLAFSSGSSKKVSNRKAKPPFNTKILDVILPYFYNVAENDKKQLLVEFKTLIDTISKNTTSAEFLNLLSGRPSKEVTIFIIDTILSGSQTKYKIIDKSKILDNREGVTEVFTAFSGLIDQDILLTLRQATIKVNTDVNALCKDLENTLASNAFDPYKEQDQIGATLSALNKDDIEVKIYKSKNYLDEQIKESKKKKLAKDLQLVKDLENLLSGRSLDGVLPSLKPQLNPDGSMTAGLLPSEPLTFEMKSAQRSVDSFFQSIRDKFNEEVTSAKYTALTTRAVKKQWSHQKALKMFPEYEDLKPAKQIAKRTYYTNELVVNPDLKKVLQENVTFGANKFEAKLIIPKPQVNMDDIQNDSEIPSDLKQKIKSAMDQADLAIAKVNNYVNLSISKTANPSEIKYDFDVKHITLGDMKFSVTESVVVTAVSESKVNDFSNIVFPQVEREEEKLKIFSKILFANNIKINLDRRNGQTKKAINYQGTADLYKEIFSSVLKASNGEYTKDVFDSPLMNLSSSDDIPADLKASFPSFGKPNILSLKLESKQSKKCLDKGFPDTHLLRTDDLKKQVMTYYQKFSAFDKDKPTDGKQTEVLGAMEKAKLYASIDLFFRVFVAEYYLRGIYVFGKQKVKDAKKEIIVPFLYNAFLKEKKLNRLKKITKDYKYLFAYYKDATNKETTNTEEVFKYLIEKNIEPIAISLDKKIKAAKFATVDKDIDTNKGLLDKLISNLPFIVVDDTTKNITFNTTYYINKFLKDTSAPSDVELREGQTKFVIAKKPLQKKNEYYLCAITKKTILQINAINGSLDPFEAFLYKTPAQDSILLTVITKIKLNDDYTLDKTDKINQTVEANFNKLVDTKQTLSYLMLLSMCQVSLVRDVEKIFNITKILILTTIEYIINNDFYYVSEYAEEDSSAFSFSVFIRAALSIPKVIVKGLAEAIDPNIGISSKISLAIRIIKELLGSIPQQDVQDAVKKIPDIPVPIISLPLGFTFPFFFTPLTIIYLILFGFDFGSDDDERNKESKAADGQEQCEEE